LNWARMARAIAIPSIIFAGMDSCDCVRHGCGSSRPMGVEEIAG
jgi:hypothetical protein